jgi:hypothetical protein
VAVKITGALIDGCVGENVKFAFVAASVPETVSVLEDEEVAFVSLVTLNRIVNVPARV